MKFELNWSGKQYAKKESYTQSEFSLIPDKNDSKNWDTTQNLYIGLQAFDKTLGKPIWCFSTNGVWVDANGNIV